MIFLLFFFNLFVLQAVNWPRLSKWLISGLSLIEAVGVLVSLFGVLSFSLWICGDGLSRGWTSNACYSYGEFFIVQLPIMFSLLIVLGFVRIWIVRHALLQSPNAEFFPVNRFNELMSPLVPGHAATPEEIPKRTRVLAWAVICGHSVFALTSIIFLGASSLNRNALGALIWTFVSGQLPSVYFAKLVFFPNLKPSWSSGIIFAALIVLYMIFIILSLSLEYYYTTVWLAGAFVLDIFVLLYQACWFSVAFARSSSSEESSSPPEAQPVAEPNVEIE